ncbi:MAG: hypothetical protein P8Y44_04565, partial [Acidobacteriota bacterium]
RQQFGVPVLSKGAVLKGFMQSEQVGDTDEAALAVLALYAAHQEQQSGLDGAISELRSKAADPFVQETADWVAHRMGIAANT